MNEKEIIKEHYRSIGSKGGKTYWQKLTKEEKSAEMQRRRQLGITKQQNVQDNISKREDNIQ